MNQISANIAYGREHFSHLTIANLCDLMWMCQNGLTVSPPTYRKIMAGEYSRRLPLVERFFEENGGMLPPGSSVDRDRRSKAVGLVGLSDLKVSITEAKALISDAFTIWPHSLGELPPPRRLTVGVTTVSLRFHVLKALLLKDDDLKSHKKSAPQIHNVLGDQSLINSLDLRTDRSKAEKLTQTVELVKQLFEELAGINPDDPGFPSRQASERNGVKFIVFTLAELFFGVQRFSLECASELEEPERDEEMVGAAQSIIDFGYVDEAASIFDLTGGWAKWTLSNAVTMAVYSGNITAIIKATEKLRGEFPDFHTSTHGHDSPPGYVDEDIWIALAVIQKFGRGIETFNTINEWIDRGKSGDVLNEQKRCLNAVWAVLNTDDALPSSSHAIDAKLYPRLKALFRDQHKHRRISK